MTAKEKAKSLVGRMERSKDMPYQYAKQCALIAVDEIIDQWEYIHAYISNGMGELNPNLQYWQEVEQELNKSE